MMQAQFKNAKDHADAIASHAAAAAHQLAGGAQSTVQQASDQLSDWVERGQQAAIWSLGSRKARSVVLSKPFLSMALVAGAGAFITYMLMRRYGQSSPQTAHRRQAQNGRDKQIAAQKTAKVNDKAKETTKTP